MTNLTKEKQKLVARIRRIRGQVDSIERSLSTDDDCAAVHMLSTEKGSPNSPELAEDLIDLVRAYLK
jgi:hypothetical protein